MAIRLVLESDLLAVEEIYNQAIRRKFCTGDLAPLGMEKRRQWFQAHPPDRYPVFVYEEGLQVSGWVSLSAYRPGRKALQETAEISYYVDDAWHGRGIGKKLVEAAIQAAVVTGKHVLFAIIIEGNQASISLLEKFGFEQWGFLPEVVHCFGETRGHIYMGRVLN